MADSPLADIKPGSPTQLQKVSSMQGGSMNRTTPPLGAVVNATTVPLAPGGCPSNPPGLAVVRSLSPPSDSNPGSSCTGVSSSTANNGTTANGPVLATAVASPAGTSPLTSSADGAPTAGSLLLGARQLNKVKRFLTTLQQFGSDVAPDVGERVHALILGLVSSTITIEDFHQSIQEITNYPQSPFVGPFLKSHLPLLQTEVLHYARAAKQTPSQYLRQHEQQLLLLLDPVPGASEPPPFGDIFFQPEAAHRDLKRRTSSANLDRRPKENGHCSSGSSSTGVLADTDIAPPSAKRPGLSSPTTRLSPAATAAHTFRFDDVPAVPLFRDRFDRFDRFDRDSSDRFYRPSCYGMLHRDYPEDRDMEDEWKNINTMLNCILGMVEKTKRALAILQHRSQAERHEFPSPVWPGSGRRHMDDLDLKKRDLMTSHHHYKAASAEMDRVSEVRRRAEEAVHEVKRQAVAELQKAVSAAESKASELVAAERTKMERLIGEARRQAAEEALAAVNHQEDSTEVRPAPGLCIATQGSSTAGTAGARRARRAAAATWRATAAPSASTRTGRTTTGCAGSSPRPAPAAAPACWPRASAVRRRPPPPGGPRPRRTSPGTRHAPL
ncbi:unnamed protein product [Ixodes pacificus]